jgi:KaiC/GvpD/RAD55 family RecA-like ATPase
MKSTVAYNILYYNAKNDGRRGAYFSLEQNTDSLLFQMAGLGMDHQIVKDKLAIFDIAETRLGVEDFGYKQSWMFIIKGAIEEAKRKFDFDLLAFDSLNVYETLSGGEDVRVSLFEFFTWLKKLGITSLLVSEITGEVEGYSKYGESFLADGVILLKMVLVDGIHRHRRIGCVKMRGMAHSTDDYSLFFRDGKLKAGKVILE